MSTSPRLMPRSPKANPSVLKVEVKLNKEETSRLQEQALKMEAETKELRHKLKQLKTEAQNETKRRRELIALGEIKHSEEMNRSQEAFKATVNAIHNAKIQKVKDSLVLQQLENCQSICASMRKTIEGSMAAVKANIKTANSVIHTTSETAKQSEASQYRAIEKKLQLLHDKIPNSHVYTQFPKRPKCQISEVTVFEKPFIADTEEQPTPTETIRFVPTSLVQRVKWITHCLE